MCPIADYRKRIFESGIVAYRSAIRMAYLPLSPALAGE